MLETLSHCQDRLAAGAHALVIAGTGAAPVNADAMKASAGLCRKFRYAGEAILATALETIQLHGLAIYGADAHASAIPATTDLSIPLCHCHGKRRPRYQQ